MLRHFLCFQRFPLLFRCGSVPRYPTSTGPSTWLFTPSSILLFFACLFMHGSSVAFLVGMALDTRSSPLHGERGWLECGLHAWEVSSSFVVFFSSLARFGHTSSHIGTGASRSTLGSAWPSLDRCMQCVTCSSLLVAFVFFSCIGAEVALLRYEYR